MKYLVTIAMFTFLFATQSNAQIRVGVGGVLGYSSEFITGVNVSGVYIGEGDLDFGAEVTYWLTDNPIVALDLNAFYLMKVVGYDDDIYISPLAGLNLTRSAKFSDANRNSLGFAVNLGVSIKKEIGDRLFIFEPKVLIEGDQDFVLKAGFVF